MVVELLKTVLVIGATELLFADSSPSRCFLAASPQHTGEGMCGETVSQLMQEDPFRDSIISGTPGLYFQLSAQSKPDVHSTGGLGRWQLMLARAVHNPKQNGGPGTISHPY